SILDYREVIAVRSWEAHMAGGGGFDQVILLDFGTGAFYSTEMSQEWESPVSWEVGSVIRDANDTDDIIADFLLLEGIADEIWINRAFPRSEVQKILVHKLTANDEWFELENRGVEGPYD